MEQSAWLTRKARGKAELSIPRRFLMPYLTVLNGDQFEVLFAVTGQWRLSNCPMSFRVSPPEIGRLRDLSVGEVHRILNQLAQVGYLDVRLASDLDGYLVTIPPPGQLRE